MVDPERYWDCVDQAFECSSSGRYEEALRWLDQALLANPAGAEAYNGRGEILWDYLDRFPHERRKRREEALGGFSRAAEIEPQYLPAQLNRIEILIEEFQHFEEALRLADGLLAGSLEAGIEAEVYYLKAKALFYLDDLEGALFLLRRAIKTQGDVGIYRGFEGQILFEIGQFEAALRSLELALRLDPECAHSVYHLALVSEHLGRYEESEQLFTEAAHLAPDMYPLPVRMDPDAFESAAEVALASLPEEIRKYTVNCPVIIEDLPDAALVREHSLSPQILGLFLGVPITASGSNPLKATAVKLDVDKILLFKRNLEKVAATRPELVEQIAITLKHEVGHCLGMDEDEVERLGLG
jgi:predicted Zn-dependent protease with MMP-like domain